MKFNHIFKGMQVEDVIFHHILNRLKTTLGFTKDKEVCEVLGLKETAFSVRKKRNSFPEKELRALVQQRPDLGIDVSYVLTGVSSAVTSATSVLRECTEQVMHLGLSSTASIAVRDIVFGVRTGNRDLVEDGIALLSGGMPVAPATSPKRGANKTENKEPGSVQVGNMTNNGNNAVQVHGSKNKISTKRS